MSLKGLTIVLTGDFQAYTRAEARAALEKLGARTSDSVSSKTSVVFAGRAAGSKLDKARGLGLPVLDEAALKATITNKALPAGTLPTTAAAAAAPARAKGRGKAAPSPTASAEAAPNTASAPTAASAPAFLEPGAMRADATAADALAALAHARWDAFDAPRDLPPLRAWLAALEARHGVTDAHRAATERLRARGAALVHPNAHAVALVAHALSPDGRYFATGSWVGDDYERGGALAIWEVAAGRCVNVIDPIPGGVGWPDYSAQLQWSPDGRVIGVGFNTNGVGAWDPFGATGKDIAHAYVTDGASRPPAWGWAPDSRRVYIVGWRQGHEVPGAIVVLEPPDARQRYNRWGTREVATTFMAKKLAQRAKTALGGEASGFGEVHWLADGTLIAGTAGSHLYAIDVATGQVRYALPNGETAAWSPDGRFLAHFAGCLKFSDGRTGAPGRAPDGREVGGALSLHWVMRGPVARLAVVAPEPTDTAGAAAGGETRAAAVDVYDDGRWRFRIDIATRAGDGGGGDAEQLGGFAFGPRGELGACLVCGATRRVEVFRLGDARAAPLRTVEVPPETGAIWIADGDVLIAASGTTLRFVRLGDGAVLGDFAFTREAPGPRPLEHDGKDHGAALRPEPTFVAAVRPGGDESARVWCAAFARGLVIAPEAARPALDGLLAWSIDRRFAWPVRWGALEIVSSARDAAGHPFAPGGVPFAKIAPPPASPPPWPPPNDVSFDAVEKVALESIAELGAGWNSHRSDLLRGAVRLRAFRGEAGRVLPLIEQIPDAPARVCAAADAATILARAGQRGAAERAFAPARAGYEAALHEYNVAEVCAAVGAAFAALGETREADALLARAVGAIEPDSNAWQHRLAVSRALIECGREADARALWTSAAFAAREPLSFYSEPSLAYLLRTGRLELAHDFLAAWRDARGQVDWSIRGRVKAWLAWLGRTDLVRAWSDVLGETSPSDDDSLATAVRVTGQGGPWRGLDPRGPRLEPTAEQIAALAADYAQIARTPRANRAWPTKQLAERAAQMGHFGAALDLLVRVAATDLNLRGQTAFDVLWIAGTGLKIAP